MTNLIKKLSEKILNHGGRAFFCGGYIRDKFLNVSMKDIDIEVYNLTSEKLELILKEFGEVKFVGKSFGVYKLDNILDVSIPRHERKIDIGHTGFEINVDPNMSFYDACKRRDLTVNAMLMDTLSNEIIDPFNGMKDLNERVLRHVDSSSFIEDPLRILRVARFASRLNFTISDETTNLCKLLVPELSSLSSERIFEEVEKILMKSEKPSIAFNWLLDIGALDKIFPELAILKLTVQGKKHHPEGDVFVHTVLALDEVPLQERSPSVMFGILCHDMGKPYCSEIFDEYIVKTKGHASIGVDIAEKFMRRITNKTSLIKDVKKLVKHHMDPINLEKNLSKKILRRMASKIDIRDLMKVYKADYNSRGFISDDRANKVSQSVLDLYDEIMAEIKPIVLGRHLIEQGLVPSSQFGIILKNMFDAQLDGLFSDLSGGICYLYDKGLIRGVAQSA